MVAAEAGEAAGGAAGGSQIGRALGAAGAPTALPGSGTGQGGGSGRPAGRTGAGRPAARPTSSPSSAGRRTRKTAPGIGRLNFRDPRRVVMAEFLICCVIAGLRPFAKSTGKNTEGTFTQFSAIAALFFTLALLTTGKKSGNVAAVFGGLVTLGVLFRNQAVFTELAAFFRSEKSGKGTDGDTTNGLVTP